MILVVQKINLVNLILIFIFKIFFKKIFFFNSSKILRNKKFFKFLKKLQIVWVSYDDFPIREHTEIKKNSINFSKKMSEELVDKVTNLILKKNLISLNDAKITLNNLLLDITEEYFEYIKFVNDNFEKEKQHKVLFFCKKNYITKKIFEKSGHKNLNIFDFTIFNDFILKKIKFSRWQKNPSIKNNHIVFKKIKDLSNFKFIFFPHKGIHDNYYLKDHYYSNNEKNLLKENILHIEWDLNEINEKSRDFYLNNNINVIEWKRIKYKKKYQNFLYSKNFVLFFLKILPILGINLSFYLLIELIKIENSKLKLKTLSKLNSIFVGNEYLFPTHLNIACRNLRKNIFTLREKTILTSYGRMSNYSKYFTVCRKNQENSIFIGNPRLKDYYKKKSEYDKLRNLRNIENVCLVLDNKSNSNWYKNGRYQRANWRQNKNFYNDIISIAKYNEEVLFLLKCKDFNWKKISEFQVILNKISKTKNIEILDNKLWDSNKCLAFCDFAIGKYTSLMDEFVTLNKPVLIFDDDFFPLDYLNLKREIFAKDIGELKEKLYKILKHKESYLFENEDWRRKLDGLFDQNIFLETLLKYAKEN